MVKLVSIQSTLNAPKNQRNTFGNYNYRNCEDIINAAKPILKDVGCVLALNDEVVLVGNRYYIKSTASLIDAETGKIHSVSAFAREEEVKKGMDASQITGLTSSYARKYALNGLFAIDDEKDTDTKEPIKELTKQTTDKPKQASTELIDESKIAVITKKAGNRIDGLLEFYKLEKIELMTVKTFFEAMKMLDKPHEVKK